MLYEQSREQLWCKLLRFRFTEAKSASEVENKKAIEAEAAKTGSTKQPKLSKAAQKMLEKLKKKYSNMDFMVADFDNASEAKEILSGGTKEYSVLFSSEELEKMASSEKSEKEYMDKIDGAVRMSNQINAKYGIQFADSKNAEITKIGVSFNKDGTATYFAELEKSSENQCGGLEQDKRGAGYRGRQI